MKKLIVTCVALTGLGLLAAETAQADHRRGFSMRFGSSGLRFGIGSRGYPGFGRGYGSGFGYGSQFCQPRGWYNNTGRWDYRLPSSYRHLNYNHYRPGGFHYHGIGHWHY